MEVAWLAWQPLLDDVTDIKQSTRAFFKYNYLQVNSVIQGQQNFNYINSKKKRQSISFKHYINWIRITMKHRVTSKTESFE